MAGIPPESAQELLEGLAVDLASAVQQTARRETVYGGSSQDVRVVGLDGDAADVVRPEDELAVASQNLSTETAVPGVSQSDLAPVTDMTTVPAEVDMIIVVDGGAATPVVFAWAGCVNGGLVAAEMQLKIQALGAEFAAATVAYVGVAPDDYYEISSGTFGRASDVIVTDGAPNNCADDLKLGIANDGYERTGYEDYHRPITSDAAGPTAPRCSAFQFTVARDVTCSSIELMVRHDPIGGAFPEGAFYVALYSGATADALVQLGVFGLLEGARVPWSEYSLVYFGLAPGIAEVDLAPGTTYWIGLCSGDPTEAPPVPAEEQWRDAALWVMKSSDGAVGQCAVDTNGDHRPEDWGIGDFAEPANVNVWFRLYQRKTVLRSVPASPHVVLPTIGERAVMERVGGDHPHRQISGARGGLSSAASYGRGASGAGSSGAGPGISSALGLTAGEVVYATGVNSVASDPGFTFDPLTGIAYATALQTAANIGIPADADLIQLAADEFTLNGLMVASPQYFTILPNTADGFDDHALAIAGGGAIAATRGAIVRVWGNEGAANQKGRCQIIAGTVATAGTYDGMITFVTAGGMARFDRSMNFFVDPDTDVYGIFGRAKVGYKGVADEVAVSHVDHHTATNYALSQTAAGATRLNAPTGQLVSVGINNSDIFVVGGSAAAPYVQLTSGAHTVAVNGQMAMVTARKTFEWQGGGTRHVGGAMIDKDVGDDRITGATVAETTLKSSAWNAAMEVVGRTMVFDIRGIGYTAKTGAGLDRELYVRVKLDGNTILTLHETVLVAADHAYFNWWARVTVDFTTTALGWVSAMGAFSNPTAGGHPMQQGYPLAEIWSDDAVVASDSPLIVTGQIVGGGGAASFLQCWKLNTAVEQI